MTETTVAQGSNGQYKVTVPKDIGNMFNLDGKAVRWERGPARNELELVIEE